MARSRNGHEMRSALRGVHAGAQRAAAVNFGAGPPAVASVPALVCGIPFCDGWRVPRLPSTLNPLSPEQEDHADAYAFPPRPGRGQQIDRRQLAERPLTTPVRRLGWK